MEKEQNKTFKDMLFPFLKYIRLSPLKFLTFRKAAALSVRQFPRYKGGITDLCSLKMESQDIWWSYLTKGNHTDH